MRHVEFQHSTVTYRHTDSTGSKPEEATVKLDQPVFDFCGGMYGLLISSLPLANGYTTATEKLTAFVELEAAIRAATQIP